MSSPNLVTTPFAHHEQIIVGLDPGVVVSTELCTGKIPSVADICAYLAVQSANGLEPTRLEGLGDQARREVYRTLEDGVSVGAFLLGMTQLLPGQTPHIELFGGNSVHMRGLHARHHSVDSLDSRKLFR